MSTDVARLFYTPEMDEFLRGFVPGHSEAEITDEFEKRFGIRLRRSQLKNRMTTLGVRQGINTGQFKKSQPAYNKGMKQSDFISAEAIEKRRQRASRKGGYLITLLVSVLDESVWIKMAISK